MQKYIENQISWVKDEIIKNYDANSKKITELVFLKGQLKTLEDALVFLKNKEDQKMKDIMSNNWNEK